MEATFGTDLGHVRIHTDQRAARAARMMEANAFTVGPHIAFAPGRYQPGTSGGDRLLAHELTHVMQQQGTSAPTVQCDKEKKADKKRRKESPKPSPAQAKTRSALELPWEHGDYTFFEDESSGIQFLVGIAREQRAAIEAIIPGIGKRIADDNKLVKDPAMQVKTVIIAPTTTRYAHLNGVPVLMLDPSHVQVPTAAHEMGHGVFHYLKERGSSKEKDAAGASAFRLKMGDIYARLSATKEVEIDGLTVAAGLWIADPSQWSPGSAKEHPWQDPDEFFASAKAAFQTDRKGLEASIAKFGKIDPAVKAPAKELLALLESFLGKGKLPAKAGLSAERAKTAQAELERETGVSKAEETIMPGSLLDWLLHPANRPKKPKAGPSLKGP